MSEVITRRTGTYTGMSFSRGPASNIQMLLSSMISKQCFPWNSFPLLAAQWTSVVMANVGVSSQHLYHMATRPLA